MNPQREKIILVDDNLTSLAAGRNILKPYYEIYPASSAGKMFETLTKVTPDLILLDIAMPGMDGYEALRLLKTDSRFASIPVIFLTAMNDYESELSGLDMGAADYVMKPFNPMLLIKRIENQLLIGSQRKAIRNYADNLELLVERKTRELLSLQSAVMDTISELIELRDAFTAGHVSRTSMYLKTLLDEMKRTGTFADEVRGWNPDFVFSSAQIHDIGKVAIPDSILNKQGRLTPEERGIMETHVTVGVSAMENIAGKTSERGFLRHALNIIGAHHEKWDGSGYPSGLSGLNIPLEGRMMAIADVYDALVSKRPYKEAYPIDIAAGIIEGNAGTHFDPELVRVFKYAKNQFSLIAGKYGTD